MNQYANKITLVVIYLSIKTSRVPKFARLTIVSKLIIAVALTDKACWYDIMNEQINEGVFLRYQNDIDSAIVRFIWMRINLNPPNICRRFMIPLS